MDTDDDLELGRELSLRNDFECAADALMMRAAAQPRSDADSVLNDWVEVLSSQKHVVACAALRVNDIHGGVVVLNNQSTEQTDRIEILNSLRTRLAKAVRDRASLRRPFDPLVDNPSEVQMCVLLANCPGVTPPTSLAVVAEVSHASLIYGMTESAAIRASVQLGSLMAERARATMAARIAQMCSSSIQVAQLRLGALVRRNVLHEEMTKEIGTVQSDLEEAQRGFDRARLLGIPWSRYGEAIEIGPLLAKIAEDLVEAAHKQVVSAEDIATLRPQSATVTAARTRISYALRDLLFGLWLLNGRSESVQIRLREESDSIVLDLSGGMLSLHTDLELTDENIGALLRDPEVFLTGPDDYEVERLIGFHLAWSLIEEMGGSLKAHLSGGSLGMTVHLPQSDFVESRSRHAAQEIT